LHLPVKADEQLIAVAVNAGAPGAIVRISNDDAELTKTLCYDNTSHPGRNYTVVGDFGVRLHGGPSGIRFVPLPFGDAIASEKTLHGVDPNPENYGLIEVEAFIVLSAAPRETSSVRPIRQSVPLALLETQDCQVAINRLSTIAEVRAIERGSLRSI
jgi:hypothetical protein